MHESSNSNHHRDWPPRELPTNVGAHNGVSFDLDADGQCEAIGWTRADSDVALLAIDRNGDGRITSGEELFGNHTVPGALNGFEALARMDYEMSGVVRTAIHTGDELFDQLSVPR